MKQFFILQVLLFMVLFPINSYGFSLLVTPTNETCPGNGSLNFTVTDTSTAGLMLFIIYKLPNTATPYASETDLSHNALAAGDYRIIARETVGSVTTTQQQDVTIASSFTPLNYTVQTLNQACSATSNISVLVSSGTATSYAIISGPVLFPSQNSNTFSGLAVGVYKVRVTDSCGNSVVQTFTVTLNAALLTVAAPKFSNTMPATCNTVVASNNITAASGTVIGYPLNLHYILHLPGGDTHIQTNLATGNLLSQTISQTIPYLLNQNYNYDLIITDACGRTYSTRNFMVDNGIRVTPVIAILACNQFSFTLNTTNFVGSYTFEFTDFPAGFNPSDFNSSYPGPFTQTTIYFGTGTPAAPAGNYTVKVTDTCGKTNTKTFSILPTPIIPVVVGTNNGCVTNDGEIKAIIPNYTIVTAVVRTAPADYPFPLPHDISTAITSEGALVLSNIPIGDYTIEVTNNCGDIVDLPPVTIDDFDSLGINIKTLKGCDIGKAGVKIKSNNGKLISVRIIAAHAGYPFQLPHDISANIVASGDLYLEGLPTGNYTFSATDSCGITTIQSAAIAGYAVTTSTFSLTANCGSFNIPLNFVDNLTGDVFGLQKLLDPATNIWGNPLTGDAYTEGTIINNSNSFLLENNTTNFNLTFNGLFRIVHYFSSYNNGSDVNSGFVNTPVKKCFEILSSTLSFNNTLSINDISRVPCSGSGNLDVYLFTNGNLPLHYRIIEKDNNPFLIDNGTSDVFLNLTPGVYKFEVEDNCGNKVNRTYDVSDLAQLVIIYPVCDLVNCAATITGNETFDLSTQSPVILGDQLPSEYILSYYTSQEDANSNRSPITNITDFNPISNRQRIYIRLSFYLLPNCYQTDSFNLITGENPAVALNPEYLQCINQPVLLNASVGNLSTTTYLWSNGIILPELTVNDIGTTNLTVTATNSYSSCNSVPFQCASTKDITITIAQLPQIDHIDSQDWTDNQNSITVITSEPGDFEYSIDGIIFQTNPSFTNLIPGIYTVFVRDKNECSTVTQEVWLLNYPKFFTPNGDGYNDTWYVKNSEKEPDFKIFIYDRYGKLITDMMSNDQGWDGKQKERLLFADDYWFVAHRQDGRILKGHFTLKR